MLQLAKTTKEWDAVRIFTNDYIDTRVYDLALNKMFILAQTFDDWSMVYDIALS